jgi:hypothetical protein
MQQLLFRFGCDSAGDACNRHSGAIHAANDGSALLFIGAARKVKRFAKIV